jgi:uncharacterized membrane protein
MTLSVIFDNFFDPGHGWEMLSRSSHVLFGITWIGLLYFFNFVQTPAFAELSPGARNEAFDKITWRALWWFRWAALFTFLTGVSMLAVQRALGSEFANYFTTAQGVSIATGSILATTMFLNVWGVIWRNQQIVIGSVRQVLAGGEADPRQPDAAKKGARASRCNTLFSIPMVWFMVFTSHFAGFYSSSSAGGRLIYWIVFVVLWGFIELSALGLIGGYDSAFNKQAFDKHRNTIVAGLILWFVLYVGGFELLLNNIS